MLLSQLDYQYPENLVATEPKSDFRTLLSKGTELREINKSEIFDLFSPGDALVINDTRVVPRRVFSLGGLEILFVRELSDEAWEVLFPAREHKLGELIALPGGVELKLVQKGLPQTVHTNRPLDVDYFLAHGDVALPPYIQKARGERRGRSQDRDWYQTAWAKSAGSCAAPTASLHFTEDDLKELRRRGVNIVTTTLHVGLGTFLPIKSERLEDHKMHSEWCRIPAESVAVLRSVKSQGRRVFALGTTALRTLESWGKGLLTQEPDGSLSGETSLYVLPGFSFQWTDVLLTNFHQPKSTLLALVVAFAGTDRTFAVYREAVAREFRLFSYGDFSIWFRQ